MPQKSVSIQVLIRDQESTENPKPVINSESVTGTTEDDGLNVAIPAGYVPSILNVPAADVLRTVHQPSTDLPAAASVSRTEDEPNNISNLAFTEA
jgi:hypothetical protein